MSQAHAIPPKIILKNLYHRYGKDFLFDNLDLAFPAGKTTCLLGISGVGKSTLLRLIAGLEVPDQGKISDSNGQDLSGRIAYMAQEDSLLEWLSVRENALLGYRLRNEDTRAVRARIDEYLDQTGLAHAKNLIPARLSGGMRQRAALVRTLAEDRDIVLMDEPFSSLDAITRLQLQDVSAKVLSGKTIVMVTHDPLEALRLGHEVRILSGFPVTLSAPHVVPENPPRDMEDPHLLKMQAALLHQLSDQKKAQTLKGKEEGGGE